MGKSAWRSAAFATVVPSLVLCAIYALVVSACAATGARASQPRDAEEFITARGTVGVWMLAFSFYAGAMGSWVVTAPAIYASGAGLLGLASYALSTGAPLIVLAHIGALARSSDPGATSLPNFLRRRFRDTERPAGRSAPDDGDGNAPGATEGLLKASWSGICVEILASVVTLFMQTVALLAEYATLGTLFRAYVGCTGFVAVIPTLLMALVTTSYTMAGGLYVSILTDRVQAIFSLILVGILAGYLIGFRHAGPMAPLTEDQKGFNYSGFSSLLTMPLSLLSSTIYSEAVWQRVWASENNAVLLRASWLGAAAVSVVVFFFGFIGFLALWVGRASAELTDINLYFFAFFSADPGASLDSFPGLAALLCAALMSEGAVDSLQNGITATLSSTLLRGKSLWATRALVVIINVPLAILGATPVVGNVLNLFLLANVVTVCCMLPLFCALLPGPLARSLVTELTVVLGCILGAVAVSVYGCLRMGSVAAGLDMAWMLNGYGYDYFLVALAGSVVGILVGMGASLALSARLPRSGRSASRGNELDAKADATGGPAPPPAVC